MNTLKNLKELLAGFDTQQQLDALTDGEFLSKFRVTQDEVEDLYSLAQVAHIGGQTMEIYAYGKKRWDKEGFELDGQHVFPFGWIRYKEGRIAAGYHGFLGALIYKIHKTPEGENFTGRWHFENECEMLAVQGNHELNVVAYFLKEENFIKNIAGR